MVAWRPAAGRDSRWNLWVVLAEHQVLDGNATWSLGLGEYGSKRRGKMKQQSSDTEHELSTKLAAALSLWLAAGGQSVGKFGAPACAQGAFPIATR